jgi:glutaredoxin 2
MLSSLFAGLMYPAMIALGSKLPEFGSKDAITYFTTHKEVQMGQTMEEAIAEKDTMIAEITEIV